MTLEASRKKLLNLYRQVAYVALREFPSLATGRSELSRVRRWVRSGIDWESEQSLKQKCGVLRYTMKEFESTISFSKYRAMRRNYEGVK